MMKRASILFSAVAVFHFAAPAYAASGENWEITTQPEVSGMSSVPGITMNVCIEKGAEKDPRKILQRDNNCEVTDVKSSGGKASWKMRCNKNGDDLSGTGEVRYKSDSFQGTTRLSGKSNGEAVDMTASYKGKKIGTPCDSSAPPVNSSKGMEDMNDIMGMAKSQMAGAMAEQCQIANYTAVELISPRFFGPGAVCAGREKHACKVIGKEVARDAAVYVKLVKHDDTSDLSLAGVCQIDMATATKSICSTVDENNYRELADYCPSEAKAFTPEQRQSGRPEPSESESGSSILENAMKLKGLLGF